MWEVCSFGNTTLHYRGFENNRFDIIRCVPCETLGGPGNWYRVAPLFTVIEENQSVARFERMRRALDTGQIAQAGPAFTVQCGQLRRYSRTHGYDPRWNKLRPDVVLPHGRNDPNIWIAKQFYAAYPNLPDAWRCSNPIHAWRSGAGAVFIDGTSPKLERATAAHAARRAKAELRALRRQDEEEARVDRLRIRKIEEEEHKQDVFVRRIARQKKWAADKAAREAAAAAHKLAVEKNPTLRWKHARRPGWKPDEDYARGGRRRNKKKAET